VSDFDPIQAPESKHSADEGHGASGQGKLYFPVEFSRRWAPLFAAAGQAARATDRVKSKVAERTLQHSIARQWRMRAQVPPRLLPIGRLSGREPVAAILAGLRLGTAALEGQLASAVDGSAGCLKVEHDALVGNRLSWTLRGRLDQMRGEGPVVELRHEDLATSFGGRLAVVEAATWTGWGFDDSMESFSRGPCNGVLIGAASMEAMNTERSRSWRAWLIGAVAPMSSAKARLQDVDVTLTRQEEDPRYSYGLSGQVARWARSRPPEKTAAGFLRALSQELTWQSPPLPPDLPQLVQAELTWERPVALREANNFILDNLVWLMSLHAGRIVVPGGIWNPEKALGYLPDLGRRLVSAPNRRVDPQVPLVAYLQPAAEAWTAADDRKRRTLRIAMAIRLSDGQTELEVAIAITSFALEMLVEQLFGETDTDDPDEAAAAVSTYGLTGPQKNNIKAALEQAIRDSAPAESDYVRDIDMIKGRLFWRTAKDKIGRVLRHYGIAFDEGELGQFINVRNKVTHGSPSEYGIEDKVQAMLFGQAMLTQSLLAELGWSGQTFDERHARLMQRKSGQ
jgi:hypothetical protein